ncbi:MAG: MATE family efflux transporter [Clostridia bacterium]|nr:MATE family efflux transporter [Clostridia bacterium]
MVKQNLFEQGSIRKTYVTLALPVTLSMVLSVVYNVADTYFIASTQDTNLVAAVSLCAPVFTLLMAFGNIFGQGGTSLISRLFGSQDTEGTKRVSAFCFYAALLTGAVIGGAMLLFHDPLLKLLGANEETYHSAYDYFMTLAAGGPLVVANFIHMNLLRAEGMSKESMMGSVSGLIVNIILDPIFISVLGWGAFGAAFASVIGYACSDTFLLIVVLKKSKILSVDMRRAMIPGKEMGNIFAIGISAALTNIMSSVAMVVLNHFLLPYGNDQVAAMGIAQKVSMIILLVLTGMSFGAAPIVGYYYGGRKYDKLKELLRFLLKTVGGTAVIMTVILFFLARPCIGMFLQDEAIIQTGVTMLRFYIVTMALAAGVMIITICFQASGKAAEALIASVCRQGVIFIAVIALASALFGYTGVLAAQATTDVITIVLLGTLFWKRFYCTLHD